MKTRHVLFLTVVVLAMATGGCCGTGRDVAGDPIEPAPAVETAGWESHPAALASVAGAAAPMATTTEVESLRALNRKLMDQVSKLMVEVQSMKQPATPVVVAEAAAPVPAAPGSLQVGAVRSAVSKSGAGEMTVSLSPEGEVRMTVPGSLCFASGRADLQPAAQEKLKKVFAALRGDFPNLRVRVEGHTDSDPIRKSKWESNEALSTARANSVASFLVAAAGMASGQVVAKGFGSDRPVAANDTPAGKAENRRVEIYLLPE
ncbi:MAG: OmpA family protein [Planctomycetes bacterium]|jgi:flagellar motor protein MotB|nr:OmpA family protein [Planctomycetota bacterium]